MQQTFEFTLTPGPQECGRVFARASSASRLDARQGSLRGGAQKPREPKAVQTRAGDSLVMSGKESHTGTHQGTHKGTHIEADNDARNAAAQPAGAFSAPAPAPVPCLLPAPFFAIAHDHKCAMKKKEKEEETRRRLSPKEKTADVSVGDAPQAEKRASRRVVRRTLNR